MFGRGITKRLTKILTAGIVILFVMTKHADARPGTVTFDDRWPVMRVEGENSMRPVSIEPVGDGSYNIYLADFLTMYGDAALTLTRDDVIVYGNNSIDSDMINVQLDKNTYYYLNIESPDRYGEIYGRTVTVDTGTYYVSDQTVYQKSKRNYVSFFTEETYVDSNLFNHNYQQYVIDERGGFEIAGTIIGSVDIDCYLYYATHGGRIAFFVDMPAHCRYKAIIMDSNKEVAAVLSSDDSNICTVNVNEGEELTVNVTAFDNVGTNTPYKLTAVWCTDVSAPDESIPVPELTLKDGQALKLFGTAINTADSYLYKVKMPDYGAYRIYNPNYTTDGWNIDLLDLNLNPVEPYSQHDTELGMYGYCDGGEYYIKVHTDNIGNDRPHNVVLRHLARNQQPLENPLLSIDADLSQYEGGVSMSCGIVIGKKGSMIDVYNASKMDMDELMFYGITYDMMLEFADMVSEFVSK